jgi:hypothetical protein
MWCLSDCLTVVKLSWAWGFCVQEEYDAVRKLHIAELKELEKKFQNMYMPILAKRCDIVAGRIDPAMTKKAVDAAERIKAAMEAEAEAAKRRQFMSSKSAMAAGTVEETEDEEGDDDEGKLDGEDSGLAPTPRNVRKLETTQGSEITLSTQKQVLGIPGFWLQAMKNHPVRACGSARLFSPPPPKSKFFFVP